MIFHDTICAPATPPGRGGVSVIRVSGSLASDIAKAVLGKVPPPRYATYATFRDERDEVIDMGLALYFPAPHSFTGESVLELQGHGGPVVVDLLLARIVKLGARLARPGEFSERAFLNGKIDLAQAEAVADLIDAATQQSARMATRTLQGVFSRSIHTLTEKLIQLRMYVEAAIDFPEEEIDFLDSPKVQQELQQLETHFEQLQKHVSTGVLLREGIRVAICGRPNAGKSSLLNALLAKDAAIVTEIPGTTRDVLREHIEIDGIPVHVVDTAGIRKTTDRIEQEGVRRAHHEIAQADRVLWVVDGCVEPVSDVTDFLNRLTELPKEKQVTIIENKIDLSGKGPDYLEPTPTQALVRLSLKTGEGLHLLKAHLKRAMGYQEGSEGGFLARRRHLDALNRAQTFVLNGKTVFQYHKAGELLAEELRLAQSALGEITGEFGAEDLLTRIFSSFCIGK